MEIKQYEYKGRQFDIIIVRDQGRYLSLIAETTDGRYECDWCSSDQPLGFGAFFEAVDHIKATVDGADAS